MNFSILFWLWAETQSEAEPGLAGRVSLPRFTPAAGPARPALSFDRAPRRGGPASRHLGLAATLASAQCPRPERLWS
jgi:hypothetical protein